MRRSERLVGWTLFLALISTPGLVLGGVDFQRNDVDLDGGIDLADAISILLFLIGVEDLVCLDAADVNDDGEVNVVDPVYSLAFLFLSDTPPPPPYPGCGADPTPDTLDCVTSPCP